MLQGEGKIKYQNDLEIKFEIIFWEGWESKAENQKVAMI